jgi:hypothetical protein
MPDVTPAPSVMIHGNHGARPAVHAPVPIAARQRVMVLVKKYCPPMTPAAHPKQNRRSFVRIESGAAEAGAAVRSGVSDSDSVSVSVSARGRHKLNMTWLSGALRRRKASIGTRKPPRTATYLGWPTGAVSQKER